jgi:hypothetical protein
MTQHRAPVSCPACSADLHVAELACEACGTRVSGHFEHCEFCALTDDQRALLRVFLSSRGNMKELERHLGVSYPTARGRLSELLSALGMAAEEPEPRLSTLEALARGEIDVDQAMSDLGE